MLNSTANTATYTPGAFTPTANRLVIMWVTASSPTAAVLDPTLTTNPLNFTKLASVLTTQVITNDRWVAVYAAFSGYSPPVGTPVLDFSSTGANMSGCQIDIWEQAGAHMSGTVAEAFAQVLVGTPATGTSHTITLAAPTPLHQGNRPAFCVFHGNLAVTTERASWTEITDQQQSAPSTQFETQYRSDVFEATGSATWTGSIIAVGIMAEIKMAAEPGLRFKPVPYVQAINHRSPI